MPANRPPIITQCAPATIALAMSPEKRMPPSAITGTSVFKRVRDVRHRGDLRHADTRDDARGADGARADADLDAVDARFDETRAASAVATLPPMTCRSPHLRLDARDRVEHALGMAVRGIDDDHVDAGLAQRRDALERVRRRADGGADAQAPALVLAGAREFRGLLEILHGDHAAQFVVAVHDQHLLDAVLVQQHRALLPSARSRAR